MSWIVIKWEFDENELQFRKKGYATFKTDEALLNFIKEIVAQSGYKCLWQITKTWQMTKIKK